MSRRIHKIMGMVMALVLSLALCACGGASKVSIDYSTCSILSFSGSKPGK